MHDEFDNSSLYRSLQNPRTRLYKASQRQAADETSLKHPCETGQRPESTRSSGHERIAHGTVGTVICVKSGSLRAFLFRRASLDTSTKVASLSTTIAPGHIRPSRAVAESAGVIRFRSGIASRSANRYTAADGNRRPVPERRLG